MRVYTGIFILLLLGKVYAIDDPGLLSVGMGLFNVTGVHKRYLWEVEYKFKPVIDQLRPQVGIFGSEMGSTYLYGGISYDIFIGKRLVFTPSFCPGVYSRGYGKDLGFPIEFRSAFEGAYRFRGGYRFGGMFYHVSNAHLSSRNPGVNNFVVFAAFPIH